ncbi:hypothetical protein E1B28_007208 [Marasmius oreades]|uniref:N-acetyltransferase domain-containing protein n=1 Tax=Marasmius oreades TaxID=181124 RepID=A0A9P7S1D1_9AGAR|nr:uncharacterized protein E1B28_007208 [Marasmius oreades]KAG7093537.1 hypothetical protein E1B28_007208 [Marasmius oreades]
MLSDSFSESDEYVEKTSNRKSLTRKKSQIRGQRKRRKVDIDKFVPTEQNPRISFEPLLEVFEEGTDDAYSFDELFESLLPGYLEERTRILSQLGGEDEHGHYLRQMTRAETFNLVNAVAQHHDHMSGPEALALRKLRLANRRRQGKGLDRTIQSSGVFAHEDLLTRSQENTVDKDKSTTIDQLSRIRTTSYESSFLSRLQGTSPANTGFLSVDWLSRTPWMNLMDDIREHYQISHPEDESPTENCGPITYTTLQAVHLDQVHDLLERSFWSGINVKDSLDYSPEKCTVVVLYKKLVVGVAIMSSPRETYITYLAVRCGWDNSQIATWMLYHLITLNPGKDITLHVSANNPAMLLYNRFGFKAEEFITGFYDAYLDPQSRASKNAIRLRFRQL